jgi:hypothetical protein
MLRPEWFKIESHTWAMNVPGGVVLRYHRLTNAEADGRYEGGHMVAGMVFVPMAAVQRVGDECFLVSTMAEMARMGAEMGMLAAEAMEKKIG